MASQGNPTTMENLPDVVLSEIFMRLLAKQLAQMRCICKSWNALLSESSFVKSHLHRSIHNKEEILFLFHRGFSVDYSLIKVRPSLSVDRKLTNFIKLPANPKSKYTSGSVIGSVNGLICFCYKPYLGDIDHVVHIRNPSLSALLTLPPCPLRSCDRFDICFGFGFDPKTDDFKVVKFTCLIVPCRMVPQVEVYSMRKGSWELISQEFPSHITRIKNQDEVCVDSHDGRLHWLGYTDEEFKAQTIVTLDLSAETFHEIHLPDSVIHRRFNTLGVLAGKLSVISRADDGGREVWVMDEYGVSESWVKHHVFSQFSNNITPYGFTSRNEFLFRHYERFRLYDPIAATTKTFKIKLKPDYISKVVEYVDSLFWIETAKRIQI